MPLIVGQQRPSLFFQLARLIDLQCSRQMIDGSRAPQITYRRVAKCVCPLTPFLLFFLVSAVGGRVRRNEGVRRQELLQELRKRKKRRRRRFLHFDERRVSTSGV